MLERLGRAGPRIFSCTKFRREPFVLCRRRLSHGPGISALCRKCNGGGRTTCFQSAQCPWRTLTGATCYSAAVPRLPDSPDPLSGCAGLGTLAKMEISCPDAFLLAVANSPPGAGVSLPRPVVLVDRALPKIELPFEAAAGCAVPTPPTLAKPPQEGVPLPTPALLMG
jgi:hypothetical protein